MNEPMSLEDACRSILGRTLADSIIASQGIHWAFAAATADARTSDDPRALKAIEKHLAEIREEASSAPQ